MIPAIFRVEERNEEFAGTVTLRIRGEAREVPTEFNPGQFNMLYAFGTGEIPISMSGSPADGNGYIHTIRSHGFVSRALADLRVGDAVGVRGPFGRGWPLDQAAGKEVLVIAGGLGMAPLRSLIYRLLSGTPEVSRLRVLYGARRPQEMLFLTELEYWSRRMELILSVDHAEGEWPGHIGVITGPLDKAEIDPDNTIAFLCGPEVMMRFCIQVLTAKALPESAIFLSMERNMKCATGHCGHCQWGPNFICKNGPVFCYEGIRRWFDIRAL
ncbi:FAD/NAD(P)-binding protein [Microbulbifer mangrovi]|uniref:FAD/NAD(P)-binding protein n=1 Tax=Microbulbifer mangrovi TaxID=927787 RepID=UPI00099034B3|nr:FAD/NAD(P)-binding protein [Microbulbifer mangrovi]